MGLFKENKSQNIIMNKLTQEKTVNCKHQQQR